MTKGYIASFDTRTKRGFVSQGQKADLIPFWAQHSDTTLNTGDPVEFAVIGGKAGVVAQHVRRV